MSFAGVTSEQYKFNVISLNVKKKIKQMQQKADQRFMCIGRPYTALSAVSVWQGDA